jgi:hypothetical protein
VELQRKLPEFHQHSGFDSPITEVAIILVANKDGEHSSLGSGIIVGHLIAMTARHVVDAFSQMHDGVDLEKLRGEGGFSLQAIQFLENGTKALAWDVVEVFPQTPQLTDNVFLRLKPRSIRYRCVSRAVFAAANPR